MNLCKSIERGNAIVNKEGEWKKEKNQELKWRSTGGVKTRKGQRDEREWGRDTKR